MRVTGRLPFVQVTIEGMGPATLRARLRRALIGNEDVKMAQRGEKTFLERSDAAYQPALRDTSTVGESVRE